MNDLHKIANIKGKVLDFNDPELLTYKIIAVDFDDTIAMTEYNEDYGIIHSGPNEKMINRIIEHKRNGAIVYIVTARIEKLEYKQHFEKGHIGYRPNVKDYLDAYHIPVDQVIYTNDALKGVYVEKIKAQVIYDDAWEQVEDCLNCGANVVIME